MSDLDIRAGENWERQLSETLETADCGILVLTKDNHNAPWVVFEAGVLSKSARLQLVIPYRVDLPLSEVAAPLARLQGVDADLNGTKKLIETLNSVLLKPVPSDRVHTLIEALWPQLRTKIVTASKEVKSNVAAHRSTEDYLLEILGLLRTRPSQQSSGPPGHNAPVTVANTIASEITRLADTLSSMDRYEREGGGASSELWWDTLVANKRRAQSLYEQALALVNEADRIKDRQGL